MFLDCAQAVSQSGWHFRAVPQVRGKEQLFLEVLVVISGLAFPAKIKVPCKQNLLGIFAVARRLGLANTSPVDPLHIFSMTTMTQHDGTVVPAQKHQQ